jgi:pimeloyl-ACP methyl ester carboxylesterase
MRIDKKHMGGKHGFCLCSGKTARIAVFAALAMTGSFALFAASGPVKEKDQTRKRYQFSDPLVKVKVFYDAAQPIEKGSRCRVAVILIHGWGGHVRTLLPIFNSALAARAFGREEAPYVIAPMFPRRETVAKNLGESDDGRALWNGSWENKPNDVPGLASDDWRGGGDANGTSFSSFDYIDRLLDHFCDRRKFPALERIVLAGFSAGGQFAGRYVAIGKANVREGVKLVYIDMSPSTQFRFEKDEMWLYGLKGRPRYASGLSDDDIMKNLCSRRVWRACGSEDVLGRPRTALDMTPSAVKQGSNRLERFLNFEKYLDKYPDWKKQTSFHIFKGIGHKEDLAYPTKEVVDFVFGIGD